jgi:hypothetical protein
VDDDVYETADDESAGKGDQREIRMWKWGKIHGRSGAQRKARRRPATVARTTRRRACDDADRPERAQFWEFVTISTVIFG